MAKTGAKNGNAGTGTRKRVNGNGTDLPERNESSGTGTEHENGNGTRKREHENGNENWNTGTELSVEQAKEVVKKRGSKWMRQLSEDGVDMAPGENSRYIRHAMASFGLPPIDISDPEQVADRIGAYFQYCAENDRRPQVVGMCNWLGISRQAMNEWVRGETRSKTHGDIIKKAYGVLEEMWIDYMDNGKINPATGIFLSKNWFDYKDVADVVVTPNDPLRDMDTETARRRLIDSVQDDDE